MRTSDEELFLGSECCGAFEATQEHSAGHTSQHDDGIHQEAVVLMGVQIFCVLRVERFFVDAGAFSCALWSSLARKESKMTTPMRFERMRSETI
jgi:hypothetical protein